MFDQMKGKPIKIKRVNPDGVTPTHVNDMIVSHDDQEFFITFAEIEPPAILDEGELEQLTSINAIAKVKLVISPNFAEAIVRALSENIEKYKIVKRGDN
ncbi:MAG: DUF3467 domain-containing protein [Candidatus Zhuqueibacterota bacterium]